MNFREQLAAIRNGDAPKTTGAKPKKPIAKVSAKKRAEQAAGKDSNGDTELVRFFKQCMKLMTGHCMNCHARTETKEYSAAIFSICHILDKRNAVAPSVKCHPQNWIELCPDCHYDFDTPPLEPGKTLWDKREEMGIWPIVKQKLISVWPDLPQAEQRHFPDSVRTWIEQNDVFVNYKTK